MPTARYLALSAHSGTPLTAYRHFGFLVHDHQQQAALCQLNMSLTTLLVLNLPNRRCGFADLHTLPAAAAAASITRLGSLQVAALQLLYALIKAGGPALLPLADGCARLLKPLLQALADGALVPGPSTPPGMTTATQVRVWMHYLVLLCPCSRMEPL